MKDERSVEIDNVLNVLHSVPLFQNDHMRTGFKFIPFHISAVGLHYKAQH